MSIRHCKWIAGILVCFLLFLALAPLWMVGPMSTTIGDWTFFIETEVSKWLNTAVYVLGLFIAVWAFRRCRKRGYLVMGVYFALFLFAWPVWPRISAALHVHRTPAEIEQRYNADFQQAVNEVLAQKGYPVQKRYPVPTGRITIRIAPMVLVLGMWLLARREPQYPRPDNLAEPRMEMRNKERK